MRSHMRVHCPQNFCQDWQNDINRLNQVNLQGLKFSHSGTDAFYVRHLRETGMLKVDLRLLFVDYKTQLYYILCAKL